MSVKEKRSSNIELLRCVLMVMVISYHYVVNSGMKLLNNINVDDVSYNFIANTLIGQLFGWGGKTGIDAFIIITGYFMCEKAISMSKWSKLLRKVIFYNFAINGLFLLVDYAPFGRKGLIIAMTSIRLLSGLKIGSDSFTTYYLLLYILIPFINACINNIGKEEFIRLIRILIFVYVLITTFTLSVVNTFSGLGCYILMYLIGAYLRKYPLKYDSLKYGVIGVSGSLLIIYASIIASDYLKITYNIGGGGFALIDQMNKAFAMFTATALFILFKNINLKYNVVVNRLASTTLGVLCIHANSDTMRNLLWRDIVNVPLLQQGDPLYFLISIIIIPFLVFMVCALIDLFYQIIESKIEAYGCSFWKRIK